MPTFGPVLTAMVTPFDADGALNLDKAKKLAKYLVANGSDGVVVAGTTGESATLTHDEQVELVAAVREALPNHNVIAGAGSNDTRAAVELTRRATEAGADAILSVTPYYNRPSQAGLEAHFKACAAATNLPVIIYDIPVRSGRKIDTDVLLRLMQIDNVIGVKDAAGDVAETASFLAQAPEGTEVYSGEDKLTLPLLSVGAVGIIGVATHWAGVETAEMVAAYTKGQIDDARRINARLIPSWDYETGLEGPNPVPSKVMMNVLGIEVGECRPPMGPVPAGLEQEARAVLAGLDRNL